MMAVVAIVAPAGFAMASPSADEIINKYIEAIGGKDALAKVNNRVIKGVFTLPDMGITANYENYTQTPNAINIVTIEGMGEVISGIKDDVAWEAHFMNGDSILDGARKATEQRRAVIEPLANWTDWYTSAEVEVDVEATEVDVEATEVDVEATEVDDEATVGDSPVHKVVLTPKEGTPETFYFDKESGLIVQRDGIGQDGMLSSTMISDYREVDGVQIAHAIEILGGMTIEIMIDSVEQNVEIAAEQFDFPPQIAALLNPPEAAASDEEAVSDEEAASDEGSDHK